MRETWYVTEEGAAVDPSECSQSDDGSFTHKSGAKIMERSPGIPMSRGVEVGETGKPAAAAKAATKPADRQMKPKKGGGRKGGKKSGTYETR